jgi:hypothetical protein
MPLDEICKDLKIGDNLRDLPYLKFPYLLGLLEQHYKRIDYLYEGQNFIVFSLS